MKVLCAGFNLFGQILCITDVNIETFKCVQYKNILDLQLSYSFVIGKSKEKIFFYGFNNNSLRQKKELFFEEEIVDISVSDTKALFLSKNGKLYKIHDTTHDLDLIPNFLQTNSDNEKKNDKIIKIASGTCLSIAISESGDIYNIPTKLDIQIPDVKSVCAGREHCLILTKDGAVYSFGGGSRGQLGHGDLQDLINPQRIECLAGIKIIKIVCGAWHSAAISSSGDLYTWGWNSNGQLGLKTNKSMDSISVMATPQAIELKENVVDVCCGSRHTIVLLDNSKLFGCGWNKYCQLGFKSVEEDFYALKFLCDFKDKKVKGLRCGSWNTVILLDD